MLILLAASAALSPGKTCALSETSHPPSPLIAGSAWYHRSTDVAKSHVEQITALTGGTHRYTVFQGGTTDGRNGWSPMGCGIAREGEFFQTWESDRSVRTENVGDIDVVNPWLSNGRNNFCSVEEIVSSAISTGMTGADKAFALQEYQNLNRSK